MNGILRLLAFNFVDRVQSLQSAVSSHMCDVDYKNFAQTSDIIYIEISTCVCSMLLFTKSADSNLVRV